MNKKWSSAKVKDVQRWLIKRWPESFARGPDLRPLALQVHKEILAHRDENVQLSTRVLREALKRHTTSYGYLYGLTKHKQRYNLKGESVGEVSGEHREWAISALRAKQKEAQRIRKEARRGAQQKSKPSLVKDNPKNKPDIRSAGAGPVIKYKPAKRKLVKPEAERTAELTG